MKSAASPFTSRIFTSAIRRVCKLLLLRLGDELAGTMDAVDPISIRSSTCCRSGRRRRVLGGNRSRARRSARNSSIASATSCSLRSRRTTERATPRGRRKRKYMRRPRAGRRLLAITRDVIDEREWRRAADRSARTTARRTDRPDLAYRYSRTKDRCARATTKVAEEPETCGRSLKGPLAILLRDLTSKLSGSAFSIKARVSGIPYKRDECAEPSAALWPSKSLVDRLEPVELDARSAARADLRRILIAGHGATDIEQRVLDGVAIACRERRPSAPCRRSSMLRSQRRRANETSSSVLRNRR